MPLSLHVRHRRQEGSVNCSLVFFRPKDVGAVTCGLLLSDTACLVPGGAGLVLPTTATDLCWHSCRCCAVESIRHFPIKAEAGDSLTFPFHLSSISARQWTPWKNSSPPQSCPTGQHSPAMEGQPSVSSPARHLRVVFFSSGVAHRAKTLRGVLRREPPSTATCTPTAHKPAQDGQTGQGLQNSC